nr:ATP-binding protein [uncultured Caldimonas sp.]
MSVATLQKRIDGALQSLSRAQKLVTDLQCYSARSPRFHCEAVPAQMVMTVAEDLRSVLDPGIQVMAAVSRDCVPIRANADALKEVLLALASNARDAMPDGGLLGLSARPCMAPDGATGVEICVVDSGMGMGDDGIARAREPFYSSRSDAPLRGMGLAAVDGLVRQFGGELSLRSFPGVGTTVKIRLQAWQPADDGPAA